MTGQSSVGLVGREFDWCTPVDTPRRDHRRRSSVGVEDSVQDVVHP